MSNNLGNNRFLSRREFTLESALAMLAGVAITVSGCGDDNTTSPTQGGGGGASSGDVSGVVSANHGHRAVVTAAEITTAGMLNLNIMGDATHPHTVSLSASQVQSIGARQRVAVTSTTNDGHDHTVTFN